MKFNACNGQCTDAGTHCEGCRRSHEEIAEMDRLIDGLVTFARKMNYENLEEFASGVEGSLRYRMGAGHQA